MPTPMQMGAVLDKTQVGTMVSPGTCRWSGHRRAEEWEIQKARGTAGATTLHGAPPIKRPVLNLHLVTEEDFDQWPAFRDYCKSLTAGSKPRAVQVLHPDLQSNDFTALTLDFVGELVYDGLGGATVQIGFIEYNPAKPKPAAKAEPAQPVPPGRPDPNAARKAELAALTSEALAP